MHTEQTLSQGGFQAVPVDKLQPGLRVISLMRLWDQHFEHFQQRTWFIPTDRPKFPSARFSA